MYLIKPSKVPRSSRNVHCTVEHVHMIIVNTAPLCSVHTPMESAQKSAVTASQSQSVCMLQVCWVHTCRAAAKEAFVSRQGLH